MSHANHSVKGSSIILKKVRDLMKKPIYDGKELSAFLVSSHDAHQSEYPMLSDRRREFVSGFTGSSGFVVITHDLALLWTDGRYFVQAEKELSDEWGMHKFGVPGSIKIEEWLRKNISAGSLVGINEKYVTYEFYSNLKKKLKLKDIILHSVKEDLIDAVWNEYERPQDSKDPIFVLDEAFAGQNFSSKIQKIQQKLSGNADAYVAYALDEICWLFNLRGCDNDTTPVFKAFAVVCDTSSHLFIKKDKLSCLNVTGHLAQHESLVIHDYEEISSFIQNLSDSGKTVWFDRFAPAMLVNVFQPEKQFIKVSPIAKAKCVKNPIEIENIKFACIKDSACICEYFARLEKEFHIHDEVSAADILLDIRKKQPNFFSLSFETISSSGPNGAIIHYRPEKASARKLSESELYLCDSGSQFKEGTTDITRVIHFGTPTEEEIHMFTLVLKGHIGLASAVFPEDTCGYQLDSFARKFLWAEGFDYLHGTGHGVGMFLNVHEGPIGISKLGGGNSVQLKPGMLLTNEPGYYETGKFGIRIENMMFVEDSCDDSKKNKTLKFNTVSLVPIQKKMIDVSALSKEEIMWINDYHAKCLASLEPHMKEHEMVMGLEWLKRQTVPL